MASLAFIGHEASLTGAPYTQLYLIQWLRAYTEHTVQLVLLRGGPLLAEFEKVATVHILHQYDPNPPFIQRIIRKVETVSGIRKANIWKALARTNPQLIFANTVPALEFAVEAKQQLHVPLLLNVHELASTFFYIDAARFARNTAAVDLFIPGSQAVKSFFQTFCLIPNEKIRVVYDFTGNITDNITGDNAKADAIRQELGIPRGAKVVGGIGALNWRKAPDLFVQAAYHCQVASKQDLYFVWVGGDINSIAHKEMLYDTQRLGLTDKLFFVGGKNNLRGYYKLFDLFLLTSREDPFPLVCLESALQGSPTICFSQAGGMPEFVRDDAGFVVPYADTQAMGERAAYLLDNEVIRHRMGATAQDRVENNHTTRVIGPQMYEAMRQFMPD
jgi:glycosyltransferase involved in cell wall biosynthesis